MSRFVLIIAFLATASSAVAQDVMLYEISAAGITIGDIKVTREAKDTLTYYSLDSKVSFWFFTKITAEYKVTSVYYRDHLLSSNVMTKTNKGNYTSTIKWNKDHYDVNANAYQYSNQESIKQPIRSNSARMYFEEPKGMDVILADGFGVLASLSPVDNGYEMDVLGKINHYHFNAGLLKRAVVYHSIKNFEVTPKPKK